MRPNRPKNDRMSSLTLYSDIFSQYGSSRRKFDTIHTKISEIIENRGVNLALPEISTYVPSQAVKKSKSLARHIVHSRGHSRPDITGTQRMTIYFSNQSPKTLAANHHCDLKSIYRIQSSPFSAFGLTFRQFKVFLCDILDDASRTFYTDVSRVPIALPPFKESFRPGRKCSISPFHESLLRAILVHKSDIYLDQILGFLLFVDPNLVSSISSLSRTLLKMGFTCKVPNRVVSRSDYSEAVLFRNIFETIPFYSFQLVFLDESSNSRKLGINMRGRAPKSVTPVSKSRNVGQRFTCVGAINIEGLLYGELIPGGLNMITFNQILTDSIFPRMQPYPQSNSVLILDNCRAHSLSPQQIFDEYGILVLFLPPYSPFLNPIERLFSALKAKIKRLIYDNSSLRKTPQNLWIEATRYCVENFNFKRVIESTYVPDETTEKISVRI